MMSDRSLSLDFEIEWRGHRQTLYNWLRDLGRQTIYDEASRTDLLRTIYDQIQPKPPVKE